MENDIRKGTVKVRDFSMDYLRAGSGKEPLVILPGMSCFCMTTTDMQHMTSRLTIKRDC